MRNTVLNKAMSASTKENGPDELKVIRERTAAVYGDYPQKKAELAGQLAGAQRDLRAAKAAQETADTLKTYDEATEAVKRAEIRVNFAKAAIEKIDVTPRMSDEDYFKAVDTCRGIMTKATDDYRKKAAALMDQLKAARDAYTETAADVNGALVALDEAANVLQSRHRPKPTTYVGNGIVPTHTVSQDPREWEKYALRYLPGDVAAMGTEPRGYHQDHETHDSVLTAAWNAVSKAYPRRYY